MAKAWPSEPSGSAERLQDLASGPWRSRTSGAVAGSWAGRLTTRWKACVWRSPFVSWNTDGRSSGIAHQRNETMMALR